MSKFENLILSTPYGQYHTDNGCLKTLNKSHIIELLKQNNFISFNEETNRVFVKDNDYNKLGVVRIDTFYRLLKQGYLKQSYMSEYPFKHYIIS